MLGAEIPRKYMEVKIKFNWYKPEKKNLQKPEMKQETIHWVIFHYNSKLIQLSEHHWIQNTQDRMGNFISQTWTRSRHTNSGLIVFI